MRQKLRSGKRLQQPPPQGSQTTHRHSAEILSLIGPMLSITLQHVPGTTNKCTVIWYSWADSSSEQARGRAQRSGARMLSSSGGSDGWNAKLRERTRKDARKQLRLELVRQSSCGKG
eukprot:6172690-Pleurochrysis_carterae.AAC.1